MPVFVGNEVIIPADRHCRSCRSVQEILHQGFAPGPTGTPERQTWPAGWWCATKGRATSELGCCEEFRLGDSAGPRVETD